MILLIAIIFIAKIFFKGSLIKAEKNALPLDFNQSFGVTAGWYVVQRIRPAGGRSMAHIPALAV